MRYLDNAKNLAMYGVHMHEAKVTSCCTTLSGYTISREYRGGKKNKTADFLIKL